MPFNTGNQQKCKACNKTVYIAEMVSPGGIAYHNTCFRCSHCNGRLALSNYSSMDGVLYCKPHFEQTLKEKGVTVRSQSFGRPQLARKPSKLSYLFSGTQEKCALCKKTVYPLEKVSVDGCFYHKNCFRCAHGGCKLTTSSYAALDGLVYCKPHFSQLFKEKGCYLSLTRSTSVRQPAGSGPFASRSMSRTDVEDSGANSD